MMLSLFRALAAAALIVLSAPAWSAGMPIPQPAPDTAGTAAGAEIAKARALMQQGKFGEALAVLRPLVAAKTVDADAVFFYGLAALGAAQRPGIGEEDREALLDEAVAVFHAMLVRRPDLVRVRLELARAFFLKGEDTLAKRHFEQVLAGKPPAAVAANVRRFLLLLRARRRWTARFGFSVAPDSNLNTASGTRTIFLDFGGQRLPFTREGDVAPKSGFGIALWGGGEYQHPLTPRLRLRAGADASAREYKGRVFDRHSASAYLGPRWLIDGRSEASLLATIQRQWTAGQPESDLYGLRLEASRRLTARVSVQARAGLRERDCRDCDWVDGPVGDIALGANWAALPTLRVGGSAGWHWSRAEDEAWRHAGPQATLNATLALPRGFTVGASASMQWADYEGSGARHHTIDRKAREDRTQTLSLSVHNRAFTLLGFSPRLSIVNEQRETNAQTLDYERNRAELSFVRQF